MEHWWNDTDRKNPKNSEKNPSQCYSVYQKTRTDWLGILRVIYHRQKRVEFKGRVHDRQNVQNKLHEKRECRMKGT
jgi:hypothetical protein